MGKLTFILGGARSGKSQLAQQLAMERGGKVLFIATAQALDEEMRQRIQIHQQQRPDGWVTLEAPQAIVQSIPDDLSSIQLVLLDCMTLLVSNILLSLGDDNNIDEKRATQAVDQEVASILQWVEEHPLDWIIVSNEVGLGLVPPYPLGRMYRDVLGRVNQKIAQRAQEVFFMLAGIALPIHALKDVLSLHSDS
ncbi:MAG: bifunctional adenosylcobinamide kinase/adenosylcobinamide-phosphate guanylyltransferase [Anaerolineales bacterium]